MTAKNPLLNHFIVKFFLQLMDSSRMVLADALHRVAILRMIPLLDEDSIDFFFRDGLDIEISNLTRQVRAFDVILGGHRLGTPVALGHIPERDIPKT